MNQILASTIPVVVMNRNNGSINRELFKVGAAMSVKLCVEV